jgi:hypothetical protein
MISLARSGEIRKADSVAAVALSSRSRTDFQSIDSVRSRCGEVVDIAIQNIIRDAEKQR